MFLSTAGMFDERLRDVDGRNSGSGVGVEARSSNGYALRAKKGRIKIDEVSGVATIKRGRKTVTESPGVDINKKTFVLLTPMSAAAAFTLYWARQSAGDEAAAVATLKELAGRGVPLPFDIK